MHADFHHQRTPADAGEIALLGDFFREKCASPAAAFDKIDVLCKGELSDKIDVLCKGELSARTRSQRAPRGKASIACRASQCCQLRAARPTRRFRADYVEEFVEGLEGCGYTGSPGEAARTIDRASTGHITLHSFVATLEQGKPEGGSMTVPPTAPDLGNTGGSPGGACRPVGGCLDEAGIHERLLRVEEWMNSQQALRCIEDPLTDKPNCGVVVLREQLFDGSSQRQAGEATLVSDGDASVIHAKFALLQASFEKHLAEFEAFAEQYGDVLANGAQSLCCPGVTTDQTKPQASADCAGLMVPEDAATTGPAPRGGVAEAQLPVGDGVAELKPSVGDQLAALDRRVSIVEKCVRLGGGVGSGAADSAPAEIDPSAGALRRDQPGTKDTKLAPALEDFQRYASADCRHKAGYQGRADAVQGRLQTIIEDSNEGNEQGGRLHAEIQPILCDAKLQETFVGERRQGLADTYPKDSAEKPSGGQEALRAMITGIGDRMQAHIVQSRHVGKLVGEQIKAATVAVANVAEEVESHTMDLRGLQDSIAELRGAATAQRAEFSQAFHERIEEVVAIVEDKVRSIGTGVKAEGAWEQRLNGMDDCIACIKSECRVHAAALDGIWTRLDLVHDCAAQHDVDPRTSPTPPLPIAASSWAGPARQLPQVDEQVELDSRGASQASLQSATERTRERFASDDMSVAYSSSGASTAAQSGWISRTMSPRTPSSTYEVLSVPGSVSCDDAGPAPKPMFARVLRMVSPRGSAASKTGPSAPAPPQPGAQPLVRMLDVAKIRQRSPSNVLAADSDKQPSYKPSHLRRFVSPHVPTSPKLTPRPVCAAVYPGASWGGRYGGAQPADTLGQRMLPQC